MGDIELPNAAINLRAREDHAAVLHAATVNHRRSVARDEDKDLGRVAKANRREGEIAKLIFRDMIDEDKKERQAAKEVEAKIARTARRVCRHAVAILRNNAGRGEHESSRLGP